MMIRFVLFITFIFIMIGCSPEIKKIKETPIEAAAPSYPEAYVIRETVNLRSSASTSGSIIKQLKDGEKIYLVENIDGWYKIQDGTGDSGWVRSDLVGPGELSYTRLASVFVDSLLPRFKSEMFFDKQDLYKTVYLILPKEYYESESKAEGFARKIGESYQQEVYPGKVELRVLTKDTDNLFTRAHLSAIRTTDLIVPIIKYGRLVSLTESNWQVKIKISMEKIPGEQKLLQQARDISHQYELPYTKTEIYFAKEGEIGLEYLRDSSIKPEDLNVCLLYYLEDKDGEYYKFNYCAD